MDKLSIEARLMALQRNAWTRVHHPERRVLDLSFEGEAVRAEVAFIHLTPPNGAGAGGPRLVLVHGTPGSLFSWGRVALGGPGFAGLAARSEIYLLDVIGHGITRSSCPPYGFRRCSDYVAGFLEGMGLENVLLAGHSFGGEFAWRTALDRPDLVARLVLVASSGYARPGSDAEPNPSSLRQLPGSGFGYLLDSCEHIRRELQPHFPFPVEDDLVSELYYLCACPENWNAAMDLARDENGAREREIRELAQPTLLLWGEDDLAYPPEPFAQRFHEDIHESRLERIASCGHHVLDTRPAEVARRIQEFIDQTWR